MKKFLTLITAGLLALLILASCSSEDMHFDGFAAYVGAMERINILPGDVAAIDFSIYMGAQGYIQGEPFSDEFKVRTQIISDGYNFSANMVRERESGIDFRFRADIAGDEVIYAGFGDNCGIRGASYFDIPFITSVLPGFEFQPFDEVWLYSVSTAAVGDQNVIQLVFNDFDDGDTNHSNTQKELILDANHRPLSLNWTYFERINGGNEFIESMNHIRLVFNAFDEEVAIDY
jgi:hypothetical protein